MAWDVRPIAVCTQCNAPLRMSNSRLLHERCGHIVDGKRLPLEPAIKRRCEQNDDGDRTQDVPSAAAPLPCFNRKVPMLSVEHLAGPNILN